VEGGGGACWTSLVQLLLLLLLGRRLLLLHVKGKVARLALVLDVLLELLWADHVTSHRGDRLTPRTYQVCRMSGARACHRGWHHPCCTGYHKHRLPRVPLVWQRGWLGMLVQAR